MSFASGAVAALGGSLPLLRPAAAAAHVNTRAGGGFSGAATNKHNIAGRSARLVPIRVRLGGGRSLSSTAAQAFVAPTTQEASISPRQQWKQQQQQQRQQQQRQHFGRGVVMCGRARCSDTSFPGQRRGAALVSRSNARDEDVVDEKTTEEEVDALAERLESLKAGRSSITH